MWTLVWLLFTTIIGYFVGDHFFSDTREYAGLLGALAGLFVGILLRCLPRIIGDIFEVIGDILT